MYEEEFEESNYYTDEFSKILDVIDITLPSIKKTRWKNKADFFALFIATANLGVKKTDTSILSQLERLLPEFAGEVEKAKNEPEAVRQNFQDYLDAATYGTNDKEKRLRRCKLLSEYLRANLQAAAE